MQLCCFLTSVSLGRGEEGPDAKARHKSMSVASTAASLIPWERGAGRGRGGKPPTSTIKPSYTRRTWPNIPDRCSHPAAPLTGPRANADVHAGCSSPGKREGLPPDLAGLALAGPTMKLPSDSPPNYLLSSCVSTSELTKMGPLCSPFGRHPRRRIPHWPKWRPIAQQPQRAQKWSNEPLVGLSPHGMHDFAQLLGQDSPATP